MTVHTYLPGCDTYTTIYNRFNRWTYAGIWDQIMEAVADTHNVDMVMVDGTSVRVHHSAATLKKRPASLHDAPVCKTLLDALQPGQHVLADNAYDPGTGCNRCHPVQIKPQDAQGL